MNLFKFRTHVVIRIVLIIFLGCFAYYFLVDTPFFLVSFWLILFAILTTISLVRFVERTYRELTNFLMAIKQSDFSTNYSEKDTHFRKLHEVFNLITREFKKVRNEKELNYHFLKTVVEHSGVPLLAFKTKDHSVELLNESVKQLLHIHHMTRLDSLQSQYSSLYQRVIQLNDGEKALIHQNIQGELFQLSIIARKIELFQESYMIIALHDVNSELDQKEIESWQKLIRVMTHEIKNSVIPISTLAEVSNQMLKDENGTGVSLKLLDEESEEDLKVSISTIEKRSKGLVKFVNAYGDLAKPPNPQKESINLFLLCKSIFELEKEQAKKQGVTFHFDSAEENLLVEIDEGMIEQVLINLVKNAIEAVSNQEDGTVELKLFSDNRIKIIDNGPGMDEQTLENIFVPFYTTKKNGSGIGLSLSRQIVKAHGGNLKVKTQPGIGSTFEINLP